MNTCIRITVAIVFCTMLALNAQAQGSLDPPIGPPTPTMKTLGQLEPRTPITNIPVTISQPGSYYLTTNFTVASSSYGITISANNVTIDLMGFVLDGDATGLSGVRQTTSYGNATLLNGTVANWTDYGVILEGRYNHVENVIAAYNENGIQVGKGSFVKSCMAISNSVASGNNYGMYLEDDSSVQDSIVTGTIAANYGYGLYAENNCRITRCTVSQTFGPVYAYGIRAGENALIVDCIADHNGGTGTRWTEGIYALDGSSIIRCVANNNGTNTSDEGIYLDGNGGSVIECIAKGNGGRGIMVYGDCLVKGNTSIGNNMGIYAYSQRNRIEGNVCNDNTDYGINTISSNNLIICNFAAQNGNDYQIDGTNIRGPETTTMTNHPWANFAIP